MGKRGACASMHTAAPGCASHQAHGRERTRGQHRVHECAPARARPRARAGPGGTPLRACWWPRSAGAGCPASAGSPGSSPAPAWPCAWCAWAPPSACARRRSPSPAAPARAKALPCQVSGTPEPGAGPLKACPMIPKYFHLHPARWLPVPQVSRAVFFWKSVLSHKEEPLAGLQALDSV